MLDAFPAFPAPIPKPTEVVTRLVSLGFEEVRQKGSHKQFRHADGRCTKWPRWRQVVDRLVVCWPVSWEGVVAVDMKWFLSWFVRGFGPGLTLALAADSAQPLADASLDLPFSLYFGLL